jgi:hypothetical protein
MALRTLDLDLVPPSASILEDVLALDHGNVGLHCIRPVPAQHLALRLFPTANSGRPDLPYVLGNDGALLIEREVFLKLPHDLYESTVAFRMFNKVYSHIPSLGNGKRGGCLLELRQLHVTTITIKIGRRSWVWTVRLAGCRTMVSIQRRLN